MSRVRVLAAALLIGAGVVAVTPAPSSARPPAERVRVISHNIAGGATFYGDPAALDVTLKQVEKFDPDIVMLQEVCWTGQYLALKEALPGWTFRFSLSYATHPRCGGGEDTPGALGDVIGTPHRLSNAWEADLPHWSHSREQRLMCADVRAPRGSTVMACTVHLKAKGFAVKSEAHYGRPVGSEQTDQVRAVVDHTSPYLRWRPVIVGGDFNIPMYGGSIQPMKPLYDESQQGQRGANPSRIDHIWSGGRDVKAQRGSTVGHGGSDHRLHRSTVRLRR